MFGIIQKTKFETDDGQLFNSEEEALVHALGQAMFAGTRLGTFPSPEASENAARYLVANFDISHKHD